MEPFLTARWTNLLNLTYAIEPEILEPHIPNGLTLDIIDGKAFVSLVAFDFLDTKVKGMKIPFHVNFPEINLRYYVNYLDTRGVAFIRELVPKYAVAWVAKWTYNEPYEAIAMDSQIREKDGKVEMIHHFNKLGHGFEIKAIGNSNQAYIPEENTLEHRFKEHEFGFGMTRDGQTLAYVVHHPYWQVYPLESVELDVDFGILYGEKWSFLNDMEPKLSLMCEGSEVVVYKDMPIREFHEYLRTRNEE